MYCSRCGAIVNEGETSCAACGLKIAPEGKAGNQENTPVTAQRPANSRNPLLVLLHVVAILLLIIVSAYVGARFSTALFGMAAAAEPTATVEAEATPSSTPAVATALLSASAQANSPTATADSLDLMAVDFVDSQVEAWIRLKYIKKDGPITVGDMKEITAFEYDTVNDKQAIEAIESLDDLRHCVNLEVLHVTKQPVSSIASLSGLEKLTNVVLFECDVKDLSPLAGKKYLREVWISGNPVADASPVLALPSLREFNAYSGTGINDISPLADTHNLTTFHCCNKLKDYSPLFGHTGMKGLTLSGISNADFTALLGSMKGLTAFRIDRSAIEETSLSLLKDRNLYGLSLEYCGIKDISALAQMGGVSDLRLSGNHIEDITPLAGLTMIDYCLDLRGNNIKDYSPLKNMKSLQSLWVMGNPVTDDETLRELEKNGCKVYR